MQKLKIVPVEVPWKISAAEGIGEYKGNTETLMITLYCEKSRKRIEKEKVLLKQKYGIIPEEIENSLTISTIEVVFETISHFSISAPQVEVFGWNQELYDTSLIDSYYHGTLNFHEVWNEKGTCPNPSFYEVVGLEDNLKKSLHIKSDKIKHWLIRGHDEEIHILARSFSWRELEALEEM